MIIPDRESEPRERRCPDCRGELETTAICLESGGEATCERAAKCDFKRARNVCRRCGYYEEV